MSVMTTATGLPHGRPLTAADLETMPDDGHRYELIDGVLIVTPSPAVPHQRAVGNLHLVLRQAAPPDVEVMLAPLDVTVSHRTVLQPDLLVAARAALSGRKMIGVPLLAIEVLSPSTRLIDLDLKRAAYARAGTASYWVVDPDVPSIIAWDLTDGGYVESARAEGIESFTPTRPFPVQVKPDALVR